MGAAPDERKRAAAVWARTISNSGSHSVIRNDVAETKRRRNPTFLLIGSSKIWERGAALTSRAQSFETDLLTEAGNLAGLAAVNRELIAGRK